MRKHVPQAASSRKKPPLGRASACSLYVRGFALTAAAKSSAQNAAARATTAWRW